MSNRDEYVIRMKAKLEEWNANIGTLAARADEVSADIRSEYNE